MPETRQVADLEAVVAQLLAYCRAEEWAGWDPYDALNSRLLVSLPILDSKIPRLVLTQALKRSPVNLRPLLQVPKTQNPKALALFLTALLRLQDRGFSENLQGEIERLAGRITELQSPGLPYFCWGYSFPWQTRTVVVPAGAPNLVCTCFVANALLDDWEAREKPRSLEMAKSAASYIMNELFWEEGDTAGFAYPMPSVRVPVHNANLLAAALLSRIYALTGEERFLGPALRTARYSVGRQQADGSWYYGEAASQRWIDNFHTGYNLCALDSIGRSVHTNEFTEVLSRGLAFYRATFFRKDGAAKYFHDRTYPIDVHCVAQSLITLSTFRDSGGEDQAQSVLAWALKHMWDRRGFFYYRVLRPFTVRIPYMRWSMAWMLLALVTLLGKPAPRRLDNSAQELASSTRRAHD